MNGIYAAYYTGVAGSGHALFTMIDGSIVGADVFGSLLDGTYRDVGDGDLEFIVTLTAPPGTSLVTGAVAGKEPLLQEIQQVLPADFGNGCPILVRTPTGPLNAVFKQLRNLP